MNEAISWVIAHGHKIAIFALLAIRILEWVQEGAADPQALLDAVEACMGEDIES